MEYAEAIAALGPAGGTLLVVVLGALGAAKAGYLHLGRASDAEPPSQAIKPCPPQVCQLPSLVGRVECLEAVVSRIEPQVAQHHRVLVTPDPGLPTLIQRLETLDGKIDRVTEILRSGQAAAREHL